MTMGKITPFLWFDDQAEEAMRFYVSIFKHSKVLEVTPGPNGKAMTVTFELEGQPLIGLNAGPQFKFTEAICSS
jgi:predicted 3-demethylubiquinone-9 3-methyltransferase (glyoxalase superfamily)